MWDKNTVVSEDLSSSTIHLISDFVFVFSCLVWSADTEHGDIVSYCWGAAAVNLAQNTASDNTHSAVTPVKWVGGDINKFYIQTCPIFRPGK